MKSATINLFIIITMFCSVKIYAATPEWNVAIKATKNADYFKSIAVINDDTVYAITSSSKVFKTTDRGANWTSTTVPFWEKGSQPRAISFANAKVGYIAGDNSIIKTIDYGKTWTKLADPGTGVLLSSVYAKSADTCYFGAKGAVYYTFDGGKTFSSTNVSVGLSSIFVTGDGVVYRAGSDGGIFKSVNQAQSFKAIFNKTTTSFIDNQISGIYFSDNNTGYVVGLKKTGEAPFANNILKTTDGGKTWAGNSLGINSPVNTKGPLGVCIPSKTGYVVGSVLDENQIYILRTTDGGETFTVDTTGALLTDYYAVAVTPCGDVYIAGNGCLLYKQTSKK
jgi:photosystem II stability/assembly factor-like uncharacterized protein